MTTVYKIVAADLWRAAEDSGVFGGRETGVRHDVTSENAPEWMSTSQTRFRPPLVT